MSGNAAKKKKMPIWLGKANASTQSTTKRATMYLDLNTRAREFMLRPRVSSCSRSYCQRIRE